MLRPTFAIEKLNAGASLEHVSLLQTHHSTKTTERHYLRFDQRRQDRLTRAPTVDFEQAQTPQPPKTAKSQGLGNARGKRCADTKYRVRPDCRC